MKDNITPEEKLLRLIRGKKKTPNKPSLRPVVQRHSAFIYGKRIVSTVFIAACIYLIFSFIRPLIGLSEIELPFFEIKEAQDQTAELDLGQQVQIKPYAHYLKGIKGKQIFNNPSDQQEDRVVAPLATNLVKDINLVGIIGGSRPQAIIEDKRARKTYYLSEGQFLSEFKLEKIEEGKIILNHNGVKFELYL